MEWMLMPYRRYAEFSGRSRRKEYWMFTLLMVIAYSVLATLAIVGGLSGAMAGQPDAQPGPMFWLAIGLFVLVALGSFIPALAVQVRRFHDQDKSGWMVLLGFIPYVGGIIVLVFMCLEGTRGSNRFGPDPKDPSGADVFA